MKPIIWVARPDKTGWNATRARDRVDYSFCVYRETDVFPARLVVRDTYTDKPGARARKVVGEFTFPNAKMAKKLVVETLDLLNDQLLYPSASNTLVTRAILRDRFMEAMMKHSVAESDTKYYSTCIWYYDLFNDDVVRPTSTVIGTYTAAPVFKAEEDTEHVEDVELEEESGFEAFFTPSSTSLPPAMTYSAATNEWAVMPPITGITSVMESLKDDVMEAMQILEQAEQVVEPVFDPESWSPGDAVPAGWAIIGGKPVQFSWPK